MAALRLQEIIVGSKDKSKEIGKLEKRLRPDYTLPIWQNLLKS
jgi:hypothetical protein